MRKIKTFADMLLEDNSEKVTFTNGDESFEVNIKDTETMEVSFDEVKRVITLGKFNDDAFGQFLASDEGPDDEDPEWIYIEDIEEDFEMIEDFTFFYISPSSETKSTLKINEMDKYISNFNKFKINELNKYNNEVGVHTPKLSLEILNRLKDETGLEFDDTSWHNDAADSLHVVGKNLQIFLPNTSETEADNFETFKHFAVSPSGEDGGDTNDITTYETIEDLIVFLKTL
jgi:hypothetical protein